MLLDYVTNLKQAIIIRLIITATNLYFTISIQTNPLTVSFSLRYQTICQNRVLALVSDKALD